MKLDSLKIQHMALDRGWTLKRLAEEAGIGKTTIYPLVRNQRKRGFSAESLHKIAMALGVKASEIVVDD